MSVAATIFDDWDNVGAVAPSLPATKASTSYGQPAINTRGKLICSTGHEPGSAHVAVPHEEKATRLATDPDRLRTIITRASSHRPTTSQQATHGPRP